MSTSHAEASANILAFASEGRLIQREWHRRASDGRELACLLGAIHPSVTSPSECDAELMPMWLAELTVVLFDGVSSSAFLPLAVRYGTLIGQWHILAPADWAEVLSATMIYLIDQAVDAARPVCEGQKYWPAVAAACEQCRSAVAAGTAGPPGARGAARAAAEAAWIAWTTEGEAAEAVAEAGAAARAAARAAASAARAAEAAESARAARAAAVRAARAAESARAAAVRAAAVRVAQAAGTAAVKAARTAEAAGWAGGAAEAESAGTAVYERIFSFVLDTLDAIVCSNGGTDK